MAQPKKFKKKGGTIFPRYDLGDILESGNVKRLADQTHTKSIDLAQLNSGVFGLRAKSSTGKVRLSAMRQFGLVEGLYNKLRATDLAKKISLETKGGEERRRLLQQSFLNAKSFKKVFSPFSGDSVTFDKIAVYAVDPVRVHPGNKESFAKIFARSAEACGLGKIEGNSVNLSRKLKPTTDEDQAKPKASKEQDGPKRPTRETLQAKPGITIKLDSTLDPKKLEDHLKLLREYGLI